MSTYEQMKNGILGTDEKIMDKNGRITIAKKFREALKISDSQKFTIYFDVENSKIILEKAE